MKIVSEQNALAAVENDMGKDTFAIYALHKRRHIAWEILKLVTLEELHTLSNIFSSLTLYRVRRDRADLWLYSCYGSNDDSTLFERLKTLEEALQEIGKRL